MATGLRDWIEIFRSGDYGEKGRYTPADLDVLVNNYNPAQHEAPLVIGHPQDDAPAYGWVESLKRAGDTLLAKFKQVTPEFVKAFGEGRFKKRSVAFYRGADGRPLSLRHVGFLGAAIPSVKGLADVTFSEGKFDTIECAGSAINFTEGRGTKASPESIERARAAEIRAAEKNISFCEALGQVIEEAHAGHFTETPSIKVDTKSVDIATTAAATARSEDISFGEALQRAHPVKFTETNVIKVNADSAEVAREAEALSRERGISFGEALSLVYEGG
ncbi:MAG: hypothetical protein LAN83_03945 [Acidobacteriia bacterium]|nr:hypothetical protein [Terriglobia bacterium]